MCACSCLPIPSPGPRGSCIKTHHVLGTVSRLHRRGRAEGLLRRASCCWLCEFSTGATLQCTRVFRRRQEPGEHEEGAKPTAVRPAERKQCILRAGVHRLGASNSRNRKQFGYVLCGHAGRLRVLLRCRGARPAIRDRRKQGHRRSVQQPMRLSCKRLSSRHRRDWQCWPKSCRQGRRDVRRRLAQHYYARVLWFPMGRLFSNRVQFELRILLGCWYPRTVEAR